MAAACGWANTTTARDMDEVAALAPRLRTENVFAIIRISAEEKPRFLPPRDGTIGNLMEQIAALPPFYTQTVTIEPVQVGSVTAARAVRLPRSTEPVPYPAYP